MRVLTPQHTLPRSASHPVPSGRASISTVSSHESDWEDSQHSREMDHWAPFVTGESCKKCDHPVESFVKALHPLRKSGLCLVCARADCLQRRTLFHELGFCIHCDEKAESGHHHYLCSFCGLNTCEACSTAPCRLRSQSIPIQLRFRGIHLLNRGRTLGPGGGSGLPTGGPVLQR